MDQPASDPQQYPALSGPLGRRLLKTLLAAMPASLRGDQEDDKAAILELLDAMAPRDAAEAQLAAIGVAAALSSMDSFIRAARPGVSEETVTRLRGNALAAGRTYAATQRLLRRRPQPTAEECPPAPEPGPEPPATAGDAPPGFLVLQPGAKRYRRRSSRATASASRYRSTAPT